MTPTFRLPPTSTDTLLNGAIRLRQPAPGYGYRFNVDALLLAHFARTCQPKPSRAADLGSGVGAIGIVYAALTRPSYLELIEINETSCELARGNVVQLSGITTRVRHADVAEAHLWPDTLTFDAVLMNPPYMTRGSGRPPRAEAVRLARQGTLTPFINAARQLLTRDGAVYICYPAPSVVELTRELQAHGLFPSSIQFVHSQERRPARLVLLEANLSISKDLLIRPPVIG